MWTAFYEKQHRMHMINPSFFLGFTPTWDCQTLGRAVFPGIHPAQLPMAALPIPATNPPPGPPRTSTSDPKATPPPPQTSAGRRRLQTGRTIHEQTVPSKATVQTYHQAPPKYRAIRAFWLPEVREDISSIPTASARYTLTLRLIVFCNVYLILI